MFDWTPYDGVEHWGRVHVVGGEDDTKDQMYLPFTQTDCWIIGRSVHVIMRYMPSQVRRQFGRIQDVVPDRFLYPVVTREYGRLWRQGTMVRFS